MNQFKIGKKIDVYYNLANPKDFALIPDPPSSFFIFITAFSVLAIGFFLCAFILDY
ncbi:hypothetical protein [Candidatus Lokiarchaeum ossiferum]